MNDDLIKKLVETVYKATISGNMKWYLSKSIFNSDTRYGYESMSNDGKTTFKFEINLEKDLSGLSSYGNDSIRILNDDIIDGSVKCDSSMSERVSEICEWLYLNHVKPTIPLKNQEKTLNSIIKNIDISEYRDSKINDVLNTKGYKSVPNNQPKELVDNIPDKRGLLKRIFNIK